MHRALQVSGPVLLVLASGAGDCAGGAPRRERSSRGHRLAVSRAHLPDRERAHRHGHRTRDQLANLRRAKEAPVFYFTNLLLSLLT